jgi:hypothetical protein
LSAPAAKVTAVQHPVWGAETLDGILAKVEGRPPLPGRAEPELFHCCGTDDPLDRRVQAHGDRNSGAVGARLHTDTDLSQLGRLLEQPHLMAALDSTSPPRPPPAISISVISAPNQVESQHRSHSARRTLACRPLDMSQ